MLKGGPGYLPDLDFDTGVEVQEVSYVHWLLAGGQPIDEVLNAWADTERMELT